MMILSDLIHTKIYLVETFNEVKRYIAIKTDVMAMILKMMIVHLKKFYKNTSLENRVRSSKR